VTNKFNIKLALSWLKANWPVVLGLLAIFVYIMAICFRLDPDLGWHLRVGEDLLKNHIFPRNDFYTFPFKGYAWRDHEWLAEVPLYWLYHIGGYPLLVFLFSCLWFLPFWLLVREKNLVSKILMILIGLAAIAPFMGVRLQVLTLVGIAILFRLFDGYLPTSSVIPTHSTEFRVNSGGIQRSGNRRLLFLFPLIMLVWANLHGSFIYGLLVGFIFLAYCFVKDRRKFWPFLISWLAGVAITLVNPYGIGLWREILLAANPAYKNLISEWVSLLALPIIYFVVLYMIFFLVFWLANYWRKLPFPAYYLASMVIFLILGVISRRNITIFILLSIPVFLELLKVDLLTSKLKKYRPLILATELVLTVAILASFSLPLLLDFQSRDIFAGSYDNYPDQKIIADLKKLPQGTPVFASYDWGGYLIQSDPNIKVFIDGRASYWQLDGGLALRKYLDILQNPADFKAAQKKYGFEVVVAGGLSSKPQFDYVLQKDLTSHLWQDFATSLIKSGNWKLIEKNADNSQELLVLKNSKSEKTLPSFNH
jgi:hypothetical protein